MTRFIKPIVFSFMEEGTRSQILFHDDPESQIVDGSSKYGILNEMLPTEFSLIGLNE
jgi:hypothetical protein